MVYLLSAVVVCESGSPLQLVFPHSSKPGSHLLQVGEESGSGTWQTVILSIDGVQPIRRYVPDLKLHLPVKRLQLNSMAIDRGLPIPRECHQLNVIDKYLRNGSFVETHQHIQLTISESHLQRQRYLHKVTIT